MVRDMISIDSKLWRVRSYNDADAHITQRSTGAIRTVRRNLLPGVERLAAMHERTFDAVLSELFHNAGVR